MKTYNVFIAHLEYERYKVEANSKEGALNIARTMRLDGLEGDEFVAGAREEVQDFVEDYIDE